jgi:hypothetical protein
MAENRGKTVSAWLTAGEEIPFISSQRKSFFQIVKSALQI